MSMFGKSYSKPKGFGRTNHYDSNGRLTGHTKTNSAGVSRHFSAGGKQTGTSRSSSRSGSWFGGKGSRGF